jgi:hypothetical protein
VSAPRAPATCCRQRCASARPQRSGVVIGYIGALLLPRLRESPVCLLPASSARPASAPGSRSRGRAATLVNVDLAPGPDEERCCCGALGDRCILPAERKAAYWHDTRVARRRAAAGSGAGADACGTGASTRRSRPCVRSPKRKRDFQGEEHECDRGMLERRRSQLVGASAGAS